MKNDEFNYRKASKVEINDGCIKCIWLEDSTITEIKDEEEGLSLRTGKDAIIEFVNGKRVLITNSEWVNLVWLK